MKKIKPLLLGKILFTIFTIIVISIYWWHYGAENFLWFSDISLFLTCIGLWLESNLIMSVLMVMLFPFEILWNIDFFMHVLTNHSLLDLTAYMFESDYSIFVRSLSLFHIIIPFIWLWTMYKWGYNKKAVWLAPILFCSVLFLTFFFTTPQKNINWIFAPEFYNLTWISSFDWILLLMTLAPFLIFWPMHVMLKRLF